MPVVSSERLTELLEKERAADAALSARNVLKMSQASYRRAYEGIISRDNWLAGYAQAVADHDEAILRFAAALPPVAAATDELPF